MTLRTIFSRFHFRALFLLLGIALLTAALQAQTPALTHHVKKDIEETNAAGVETEAGIQTNIVDVALMGIGERAKQFSDDHEWARDTMYGVPLWRIVGALLFVGLGFLMKLLVHIFLRQEFAALISRASKGKVTFDRVVLSAARQPLSYLFLVSGIAAGCAVLFHQTENAWPILRTCYIIVLAFLLIWFFFRCFDMVGTLLSQRAAATESKIDEHVISLIRKALKFSLSLIIILWASSSLGFEITALIAGLGIAGLAVALGLQDTLANLFGSIFIMLDKPFKVGDRIILNSTDGVVEEIGLRSTRIRTLNKTQVSIPNKTVADTSIENIARIQMRKIVQTIGLTYETTADQMEEVLEDIRTIIHEDEDIDQDFTLVRFDSFGESSLNILVIYFTKTIDYAKHLEIKERINLAFMRAIRTRGLSIAFPTRSLYFENVNMTPLFSSDTAQNAASREQE